MNSQPRAEVSKSLQSWNPDRDFGVRLFGDKAYTRLEAARQFDLAGSTLVVCSYENPWGRAGGLYAVASRLGRAYQDQKTDKGANLFHKVVLVSPYHVGLKSFPDLFPIVATIEVHFAGRLWRVAIHTAVVDGVVWCLIRAPGFFEAEGGRSRSNPYLYIADARATTGSPCLLRDALFLSKAIPQVVAALGYRDRVLFHLKDWQTALVALTGKESLLSNHVESLRSAAFIFTQHNPYDHSLTWEAWRDLTDLSVPDLHDFTVQNTALRLIDAPPTVVSWPFAHELTIDTLHTLYFVPHLQEVLRRGVVGVDNGPFVEVPHQTEPDIVKVKNESRQTMLAALGDFQRTAQPGLEVRGGIWAAESNQSPADLAAQVPVFVMSGRLDPRQKGFDVMAAAIDQTLEHAAWDTRFILMPEPGDAPESFVEQLKLVAERHPGRVLLVIGRMPKALYESIQAGATFSVWPSIYEPFGGVSEYLLVCTPVVARLTGGLVQQVRDIDADPTTGNGIAYPTDDPAAREEWAAFLDVDPAARLHSSCGRKHIGALCAALTRATETFANSVLYRRLLENLRRPDEQFSWCRAVAEYLLVLNSAVAWRPVVASASSR